jgi:eukaryotic translation initiation factor 2C
MSAPKGPAGDTIGAGKESTAKNSQTLSATPKAKIVPAVPAFSLLQKKSSQASSTMAPSQPGVTTSNVQQQASRPVPSGSTTTQAHTITTRPGGTDQSSGQSGQADEQIPRLKVFNNSTVQTNMSDTGNPTEIPNNLLGKLQQIQDNESDYPIREAFRQSSTELLTNYFEINVAENATMYEYRIEGIPDKKPLRLKKLFVEAIIDEVPFLNDKKDFFAHDSVGTIIAWKCLHDEAPRQPETVGSGPDGEGNIWRLLDTEQRKDEDDLSINLKYVRRVDLNGLRRCVSSDPELPGWNTAIWNSNLAVNALNIVISKCFEGEIVKLGSNKFFVQRSWSSLGEDDGTNYRSLCTIRGYYYTIKAGMGKILLNVNTATSAFYRPLTVDQYLRDEQTFGKDRYQNLKGVRVSIRYDRGEGAEESRMNTDQGHIKTVCEVSRNKVKDLEFTHTFKDKTTGKYKSEKKTVEAYLQESKSNPHFEVLCG